MHLWDPHSMSVAHRHALSRAVGALVHVFISHGVNGHNIHRRSFWFDCTCLLTASEQQRQSKATMWAGYSFHIHSQNWGSFQGYRTTPWNFILRSWFLLWITVYSQITRKLSPELVLKVLFHQRIFSSCDNSTCLHSSLDMSYITKPCLSADKLDKSDPYMGCSQPISWCKKNFFIY